MRTQHQLAAGLIALGSGVAVTALLGPAGSGVLVYRTSAEVRTQIAGGDLAALLVVAPLCLLLAVLAARAHPAAPVLALAPAGYAAYMYSQLVMGNEYLQQPGNVERFFPFLLALVLVAGWVWLVAWRAVGEAGLPDPSRRQDRVVGSALLVLAAYVLIGIHLGSYVDAVSAHPQNTEYLGAPTAFWAVKLWDLAVVLPAALVVGTGALRHRPWARRPVYAILGGYLLLGCSVAGMAWAMLLDDAGGSLAQALVITSLVAALAAAAARLYRPLFTHHQSTSTEVMA